MMNAEFREWDFLKMEYFLQSKEDFYSFFYNCYNERDEFSRNYGHFYHSPDFVIVYLEDYTENKEQGYDLLLDFFTPFDYLSFLNTFRSEIIKDEHNWENNYSKVPKSTFFRVDRYKMDDEPEKGAHYYLDMRKLRENNPNVELGKQEEFPLLCVMTLPLRNQEELQNNMMILYQTHPLIYPQWLFSSMNHIIELEEVPDNEEMELIVWDVDQGNFNELSIGGEAGKPYVIFDAGTEVLNNTVPFYSLLHKLNNEIAKAEIPLVVLSHWHTDHYSLLFAESDSNLKRMQQCVFPSYVKNLSVFLFLARLNLLGVKVLMKKLPHKSLWVKLPVNKKVTVYANRYVHSCVNNSGLTLFVQGRNNNAMLSGDCRYRLVESQANDSIMVLMKDGQKHYLVIPHHCGEAGAVSYIVPNAKTIEGIVSVGRTGRHGHPNEEVRKKIEKFVNAIEMTKDLKGVDRIRKEL